MRPKRSRVNWPALLVAAGCLQCSPMVVGAPASPGDALLRSAQMWTAKNRPDIARQMLEKLLLAEPDSAQGLAAMGALWVQEGKLDPANQVLQTLRARHPAHPMTRELETLVRVSGAQGEKLANMRLLARAGRKAEAAELARELFPQGNAPALGGLALEYHQIVGAAQRGNDSVRQLERLYTESGDPRYRLAAIDLQLTQGVRSDAVLPALEALANQAEVNTLQLRSVWRRALDSLSNQASNIPRVQRFLNRYPEDEGGVERLAAMQQAHERAQREARDPANIALKAAIAALDEGELQQAEDQLLKALELRPNDAESLGHLGLVRLRQGQHAQALALFQQAYKRSPQNKWRDLQTTTRFWGLLRQADLAVEEQALTTAAELVQKALSMQPQNPEALVALADVRKLQADMPAAMALYEQALKHQPDHASALRGLANLLAQQGETTQAMALLDRAAASDPALAGKLAPARASMLSALADQHIQAKRLSAALQALESAVLLAPDDPWLRHSLARLYVRLELPRFALGVMDDGVGQQPALSAMRYARALIRSAVDDDAGALEDLGQIPVAERTDSMLAMVRRAVIQSLLAQATGPDWGGQTTALLNAAEERAGDDVGLLQSVAFAWNRLGQPEQGRAVFDRLVERAPKITPELQLQHAQWMNRVRDDRALARLLPELLGTTGWDDAQQNQLLALYADHQARQIEAHQEDGDAPAARQLAQAPLPAVPDASLRERTRARLLMAASEYADAAAALEQVLASEPDDADLRLELGRAWARAARPDQARAQAQWLQNNLPGDHLEAQLALLRLWQLIGDDTQVRALSDRLLREVASGAQTPTGAAPQNPQALATAPQRLGLQSEVLSTAARLERAEGRYAQAVGLFQQALNIEALGENGVPQAPAATPPVATGVLTDAEPQPRLRLTPELSAVVGADSAPDPVTAVTTANRIQRELDDIEARRQRWVEAGQRMLNKTATSGISTLNGWEGTAVAWWPKGYDGQYFVHLDQLHLNAGGLPVDRADALDYGQVAAWPSAAYPTQGAVQRASGTNLGIGFVADRWRWDVGAVGIGFPVTNLVGGVKTSGDWGDLRYQLDLHRRPVTGSLLSYAGARDPITGAIWGGVVATGLSARVSGDVGPYSMSLSASHDGLTGRQVQRNQRTQLRWAADQDVLRTPHHLVNAGLSVTLTRHAHDLSEYSWGQGGYYSPQRLASISMPVEWSGRLGAWSWLGRGSLSWSASSSGDTDYFPGHPDLQAQAGNLVYKGSSGSGFSASLRGGLEHQTTRNLALGAWIELDRSEDYAPTHLLLYARYFFDPVRVPLEKRARPVQAYSSY